MNSRKHENIESTKEARLPKWVYILVALVWGAVLLLLFFALLNEMKPEPKDTSHFYEAKHIDETE